MTDQHLTFLNWLVGCLLAPHSRHSTQQPRQIWFVSRPRLPFEQGFNHAWRQQSQPQHLPPITPLDPLCPSHFANRPIPPLIQHPLPPERPSQRLHQSGVSPDPHWRTRVTAGRDDRLPPRPSPDGQRQLHGDAARPAQAATGRPADAGWILFGGRMSMVTLGGGWTDRGGMRWCRVRRSHGGIAETVPGESH